MYPLTQTETMKTNSARFEVARPEPLVVEKLTAGAEPEVLTFLNERPGYTFGMVGFIRNNGLESLHNRGTFYGCRDREGLLQGVALIGHYILLETRCGSAIEAFARLAQECRNAHMLLGERDKIEVFWQHYAEKGQSPRLMCREMLLEQTWPIDVKETVTDLRLADLNDLELIVPAHAQLAYDESGIDPLVKDPEGFRRRCARRIEQGKTWVLVEEGRLIFKADVISDSAEIAYLEGIWVDPAERGKGHGLRCMSQLNRELLANSGSVCLLVNEKFEESQRFYKKAGFKFIGVFDTIFLNQDKAN
jgi:predicted GNAT family acetyltransferase